MLWIYLQSACNASLDHLVQQDVGASENHEVMEVIGELDPQTGVYSIHQATAGTFLVLPFLYIMNVCL